MGERFSRFAEWCAKLVGSYQAFVIALVLVVGWVVSGPLFGFSDTWQLVINTVTTISTGLIVFLLQNSQNRQIAALHVKLDELILAVGSARNELMQAEELTGDELAQKLYDYQQRARARAE